MAEQWSPWLWNWYRGLINRYQGAKRYPSPPQVSPAEYQRMNPVDIWAQILGATPKGGGKFRAPYPLDLRSIGGKPMSKERQAEFERFIQKPFTNIGGRPWLALLSQPKKK